MPRKYRHIQEHEKEILELRSQGMTLREIGEKLGFTHKEMRGFLSRYNRKQRKLAAGIRKICGNLSSWRKVSGLQDVQVLWRFPEWVLRLHPQSEPSEPKSADYRPDRPAAEEVQKYIRLSSDASVARQKRLSQESKNCPQTYENQRIVV